MAVQTMSGLVAIDVDGTIHLDQDFPGPTEVRPNFNMLDVIRVLKGLGVTVVLWSANGADYARTVAVAVGLEERIDGYFPKPPTRPINATTAAAVLGVIPLLTIDDKPTEAIPSVAFLRP